MTDSVIPSLKPKQIMIELKSSPDSFPIDFAQYIYKKMNNSRVSYLGFPEDSPAIIPPGQKIMDIFWKLDSAPKSNERCSIHELVAIGQFYCCSKIDRKQFNPNQRDRHGRTPLMYAVHTHSCCIDRLLELNADCTLVDMDGNTVLHYLYGNVEVDYIDKFIERGADINHKNNYGLTVLDYAIIQHLSIDPLIERGAKWQDLPDSYRFNYILTDGLNNKQVLKSLKKDGLLSANGHKILVWDYAVKNNFPLIPLLKSGIKWETIPQEYRLDVLFSEGLSNNALFNHLFSDGLQIDFYVISSFKQKDALSSLIDCTLSFNNKKKLFSCIDISSIVQKTTGEFVDEELELWYCEQFCKALKKNDKKQLELLLTYFHLPNPDAVHRSKAIRNFYTIELLDAIQKNNYKYLKRLLKVFRNPDCAMLHDKSFYLDADTYNSPLAFAVMGKHKKATKILLQAGADPDVIGICNSMASTGFFYSMNNNYGEYAKLLIQSGADLSVSTNIAAVFISNAAADDNVKVLRYLVRHGVNLFQDNPYNYNILKEVTPEKQPKVSAYLNELNRQI